MRICVLYYTDNGGYYMYQAIYIDRGEGFGNDTVHLWDDQLGYKTMPYRNFDYAYKPDKSGQYVSMTGVRLAKVKRRLAYSLIYI
jgi:hypothetical protein